MGRIPKLLLTAGCGLLLAAAHAPTASAADAGAAPRNFVAHLNGAEVVPARTTTAEANVAMQLDEDGKTLSYRITGKKIMNIVAAHIHLGVYGVDGGVVAFLAGPFNPAGGETDGVVGEGEITSSSLVGPLAGMDLSVLLAAMRTGGAYIDIHTDDGLGAKNTGAGDFFDGELRGQVRVDRPVKVE